MAPVDPLTYAIDDDLSEVLRGLGAPVAGGHERCGVVPGVVLTAAGMGGSGTMALLGWCARAGASLCSGPVLTSVGLRSLRMLLVALSERPDLLSPELSSWLSTTVVPRLVGSDAANTSPEGDLIYLLLRALLARAQQPSPSSTATAGPSEEGETRRGARGSGRARTSGGRGRNRSPAGGDGDAAPAKRSRPRTSRTTDEPASPPTVTASEAPATDV